ncbi:MAG: hypothetical protein FWG66_13765 [Spirochaetes bacterium]|nr:hypothetical protein [Spirochaetota bacterium]
MDNDFEIFIKNLMKIEKELNLLYKDSENLLDNLIDKIGLSNLSNKDEIISKYEGLLTSVSHEFESEIGFLRQQIILLNNYTQFRIKHDGFSEEILQKIIDDDLTITEKKEAFKENRAKETIEKIKEIKQEWEKVFKNASYKKVKESINLNKP